LKAKLIESKSQCVTEGLKAFRSLTGETDVYILGGARTLRKTEFHGNAAFQIVVVQDALLNGPFEHTAKSKERNPPAKAFLS
jgi:hypothetical protein